MSEVRAVLFAKDHTKVARFYREALGLIFTAGDEDHSVLNCRGFELVVHQIPKQYLNESSREEIPVRRENSPIRLDFPVDSIDSARSLAATLGGRVDDSPPAWAPRDAKFCLGHDPEGNVFKLIEHES
jgi:catechol 2,3-dioxygenase-like lactoylglutathione lyase family enzyme